MWSEKAKVVSVSQSVHTLGPFNPLNPLPLHIASLIPSAHACIPKAFSFSLPMLSFRLFSLGSGSHFPLVPFPLLLPVLQAYALPIFPCFATVHTGHIPLLFLSTLLFSALLLGIPRLSRRS